jgi:hypothetical protein
MHMALKDAVLSLVRGHQGYRHYSGVPPAMHTHLQQGTFTRNELPFICHTPHKGLRPSHTHRFKHINTVGGVSTMLTKTGLM